MQRSNIKIVIAFVIAAAQVAAIQLVAQEQPDLSGQWVLNRERSELPRELGFNVDFGGVAGGASGGGGGGGRGRRSSGGGSNRVPAGFSARPESEDDATRMQQLSADARVPPAELTIEESPSALTITNDKGRSQTIHPTGREETLQLDTVPLGVTSRWETGHLSVTYNVEAGRDLRYTYSIAPASHELVVEVQFIERGRLGDHARRVYEASHHVDTPVARAPALPGRGAPASNAAQTPSAQGGTSSSQPASTPTFDQTPGADLKGLRRLAVLVEGLSSQSGACGLRQEAIESALTKRLKDAGLTVVQQTSEDTYLQVTVITAAPSAGLCVSRYDATLYTYTTATLSYGQRPVLAQVSLFHKGGIAGSGPTGHGDSVLRGLEGYVDEAVMQIRNANR